MKRLSVLLMTVCLVVLTVQGAGAVEFNMYESAINRDGTITNSFSGLFSSATYSLTVNTAGNHFLAVFVDPEIDETVNTFFNEYGAVIGAPVAGQSWEIDEPGYVFGNIYSNFAAGTLDNMIFGGAFLGPEDVSMALGWDFNLQSGETATAVFKISAVAPTGFYLTQTDPDSQATLYFSSTLDIKGGGSFETVPEPSTFTLLGSAVAGLAFYMRRRERRQ